MTYSDAQTSGSHGALRNDGRWPSGSSPKGHVLVVEAEELVRESLGTLLEEDGYLVSFAENGHEALTWLRDATPPDVIVLDLRMPVMDGWEFRAIQKKDPRLCRVPVVALSADGSAQAAAISAHAYLRRPVEAKEFLATVARVRLDRTAVGQAPPDTWQRSVAGVGHEVSNPLELVLLNIHQALAELKASLRALGPSRAAPLSQAELDVIEGSLENAAALLEDCQTGGERIRITVANLQKLAPQDEWHFRASDPPKR